MALAKLQAVVCQSFVMPQQGSVFVGARCAIDDQFLLHHKKVADGHSKVLITTVFARRANNGTGFNPDKHSPET